MFSSVSHEYKVSPAPLRINTSEDAVVSLSSEGKLFFVTSTIHHISANKQLILKLDNPVGSDVFLNIAKLLTGSNYDMHIALIRSCNDNDDDKALSLTPYNAKTGEFNNSVVYAKLYISHTVDKLKGEIMATYIQLGGTMAIDFSGSIKIGSGNSLTICLTNITNRMCSMSITVSYYES